MLATIYKKQNSYVAKFTRPLPHSVDAVWSVLTENEKLQKWMSNLEIVDLRKNGIMRFNMNDGSGTFIEIVITDYIETEVLEFDWGKDSVRFKLSPAGEGSLLELQEIISELTNHTPKDLAGWHVCLDQFCKLLNGIIEKEFPMEDWKRYFEQYNLLVANMH